MKSEKTYVVLFGSSGFIGGNLYRKFNKCNNYDISGYSSSACNLFYLDEVNHVFSKIDGDFVVILTSAITRLKANSYDSMIKNILMVENICRAIPRENVKQIMFMSTIDVYGVNIGINEIINEALLPNPSDYYSVSKAISEYLLKMYCTKYSIPLLILRMPGVYGYGDNFKSTIGMMIKNAFDKKEIGVFGKGENMRDFVLVDDLYNILTYAIMNKINGLVNITSGKSLSINEIAKLIRELHPFSVNIKHFPEKKRAEKRVKNLIFDSSMFKATFNNIQMTAHEQGISVYIHSINDDLERNSPIDSF